ncbi:arginase [Lysinibacillus odysseyi 34hs-1 = NBRC 100172]|uniref:Arginase n=2 Tax=Lysinibacillus odysseyi TaxID=202611 RepID=A0A0A3J3E0_9BACI|nr:arginase [Lysinibacillus odysseyi 34hs-1 = NBRC 100172]
MKEMNTVGIVGVPMDLGQERRGVDMGPSAIRYAGLQDRLLSLGYSVIDYGDIPVKGRSPVQIGDANLKNLQSVVEASLNVKESVMKMLKDDVFPLILGGDHSISIGTLAAINEKRQNVGVIWYDAHGDLNIPETSPSGNIHGMPLAVNLNLGHSSLTSIGAHKIKPENIVLIGARALDEGEKELIQRLGIKVFTMHEIDRMGMTAVIEQTISHLKDTDGVHLSLDLDALDPMECPGVGTPVRGGITYRESHLAMEMLAESGLITSAELVEVNPILDDRNQTAEVAVALAGSLFGDKLL